MELATFASVLELLALNVRKNGETESIFTLREKGAPSPNDFASLQHLQRSAE